jgi:Ca2+/H+ antiporter
MIIILTIALSVTLGNTEKRVFYRDVLIVACSIIVSLICLLFLIFPLFFRLTKHAKAIYKQKSTSIRSPEEGYSESFAEYYYPPPAVRVRIPNLTYNGRGIYREGSSFTNWAHSSVDTGNQTKSVSSAKLTDFSDPDFSLNLRSESGRSTPKIDSMSLVDEESTLSIG